MSIPGLEPITRLGFSALKTKVDKLQEKRRLLVERKSSDFSQPLPEDTDYVFLMESISNVEKEIADSQKLISTSSVVDTSALDTSRIRFGFTIELTNFDDEDSKLSYTLVGPAEGDILKGKISIKCKVGSELIGKALDDEIQVGEHSYYISKIENNNVA